MPERPRRVAILGTRGIPAAYGGFETLAWELSTRLAARGHEVTVYCRRGRTDELIAVPPGVRRRFLPYLPGKYFETVSHTALSALDSVLAATTRSPQYSRSGPVLGGGGRRPVRLADSQPRSVERVTACLANGCPTHHLVRRAQRRAPGARCRRHPSPPPSTAVVESPRRYRTR